MITKRKRLTASLFLALFVSQMLFPIAAMALTSGPTQPEVQGFQPAGTSDMVDLFTGDFSYNIPLFELPGPNGGYPFNLSYQAGINMDQEASWVGLGWSMQPGAITRQMRGLPDEFKGDVVQTKMSINPSVTVGLGAGVGVEIFGGDLGLSIGIGFSQNNYKGFGYYIDATIGSGKAASSSMTGALNLSVDSKEGVGVAPSLNLDYKTGTMGIGANYNSKQGLTGISLSANSVRRVDGSNNKSERKEFENFGINISLAHPSYTPQLSMEMKNINLSAQLKVGGNWWGVSGMAYVKGFYNEQVLVNKGKFMPSPAYGYLNLQHALDDKALTDFNREKDGMVSKETPNLAMPSLTYDIYSISGQGIGSMFRPYRNDYGIIKDQIVESKSTSVGVGIDFAPAATHVGVNLTVNHSLSRSGPWGYPSNEVVFASPFQSQTLGATGEPAFFKIPGEPTSMPYSNLQSIGNETPVRFKLENVKENPKVYAQLEANKSATSFNLPTYSQQRKPRNQAITAITNDDLLGADGNELLPEYKISYFESNGQSVQPFQRPTGSQDNHLTAGYTALSSDGLRYVYGLPAHNLMQEEATFSVLPNPNIETENRVNVINTGDGDPKFDYDGTDEFLKRVQLPKYAHSFLLTSILGADYVDVTNDGVTTDDLGYWVKFTYRKMTNDFRWRDPYSRAHLNLGWRSDPRDDKGSFTYGVKEIWYLAQAETKTHIATFEVSERRDGRGVSQKLQDADLMGQPLYKLDKIVLYSKFASSANPIKTTRFEYDYSLCKNVNNNDGASQVVNGVDINLNKNGKLTLKKVWFEYGTSARGKLNPYEFTYSASNPDYSILAYDRWGNFKPYPSESEKYRNIDFPYTEQDPAKKSDIDSYAEAWSLTKIELPSGGTIEVDYETDDYAFVQNKQAMQMMPVVNPLANGSTAFNLGHGNNDMAVRFKLEQPIFDALTPEQQRKEVLKYIDIKTWQLYFKFLMYLRYPSEDQFREFISGYVDIDKNREQEFSLETETVGGPYVYGKFYVKKEKGYNPFALRAWQHLRTNQPDIANTGKRMKLATSNDGKIDQIKSMGSLGTQLKQLFQGFNDYCKGKGWGQKVDANRSWVRLNSPDKIKYGGGLRVRQITMRDNWEHDTEGVYGQVYEYITNLGSETISSGVAAYEPIIGGEENALHYAKKYTQAVPLRTDNNLYFEYPINEGSYPGPQVGYSKVSVYSMAAAARKGLPLATGTNIFPSKTNAPPGTDVSFGTSGKTEHEFYTARDFPVITEETDKIDRQFKMALNIPLMGSLTTMKLTSSQGYSVITNNMHGKQKGVASYRQNKWGDFDAEPISWVRYYYKTETKTINGERIQALNNTMAQDGPNMLRIPDSNDMATPSSLYTMGQEVDFVYDMREYEDQAWGGGKNFNKDVLYLLFVTVPIPTKWPNLTRSITRLRVATTNKIIFKTGILERTEAFDGGSRVVTHNKKWDRQTGTVVLTTVNNNFDQLVYNYTLPAFREYQGMGAAYQNVGLTFNMTSVQKLPYKDKDYEFYHGLTSGLLQPGDEILLYPAEGDLKTPIARAVYTGPLDGDETFYTEQALTATSFRGKVVRSGFRNQLNVAAATITALEDPSKPVAGSAAVYTKTITVPKN